MIAHCCDCHAPFARRLGEEWKVRCYACWLAVKGTTRPTVTPTADPVVGELRDHLPGLIRLAHPDRHGNSPLSNRITGWLLGLRDRIGGAA